MSNQKNAGYRPRLPMPDLVSAPSDEVKSAVRCELYAIQRATVDPKTDAPKVVEELAISFNGGLYRIPDSDSVVPRLEQYPPSLARQILSIADLIQRKLEENPPNATQGAPTTAPGVPAGILSHVDSANRAPR